MRYLVLIILVSILDASTVRIMTYNLLNYQDENSREDDYALIIDFIQPDLIVAQEIIGETGYSHFRSDVLDVLDVNPPVAEGAAASERANDR